MMTDTAPAATDRTTRLRAYAAVRKQETVKRLQQAIAQLEADGRPVNTFTIKEVSSLDYMAYYRNREAFALFQEHSTHLRQKRAEKQMKKQAGDGQPKRKNTREDVEALQAFNVSPRDRRLDYKRPRLVELLQETEAELVAIKEHSQAEYAELEQRYSRLLQEHMHCGLRIARLEAQVAEHLAFMDRYRSALQREEHGSQS